MTLPKFVRNKMKRGFEIVDHTADIGIIAYGTDIKQAFANAAFALFSLITDLAKVKEDLCYETALEAEDEESLLVQWLNELIYLFEVEQVLFKRFDIETLTKVHFKAKCYGEKIKPSQHKLKMGIKAATYHMLKIEKDGNLYRAQVIFDV